MLTKKDLRHNFVTFRFLSKAWRFPAKFNQSTGSFHIEDGGRRRKGFRIVLAICMVYSILMSGRTFVAGAVSRDTPLEFLAFGIMASIASLCLGVMGILVDQTLEIQVKLWTELLDRINRAGRTGQPRKKTWEELWICYMPFFIYQVGLTWPIVYSINPTLPFLLYGNVPTVFMSTPVLVLCCLLEVILSTFYAAISNYFVVFIMLFVRQMKIELQVLKDEITRFGLNPECGRATMPQPVRFLEIEENIMQSNAGVMVAVKNELSPPAKMQVVCEIQKSVKVANEIRVENEVKQKKGNQVKQRSRRGIEAKVELEMETIRREADDVRHDVEAKVGSEVGKVGTALEEIKEDAVEKSKRHLFPRVSKNAIKRVKSWALKRAEKWIFPKMGRRVVKHPDTRRGKAIEKWAVKRENQWAVNRKMASPTSMETDNKLAENKDEERKTKNSIECVKNEENSGSEELKTACTALEVFRLLFRLFNLGFSNIIFLLKMVGLALSILGLFAAVRLAARHPEYASCYGLIAAICVISYIGMFNSAFHLTGQAEACKSLILLQSTTLLNREQQSKEEWNEIRCRIAAIPKLAIYSGHFHPLEQDSTPVFINFVLNKLADLLLAF